MRKIIPVLPALLLLIISLSGCSVKEDRNSCPCLLVLDMGGIAGGPGEDLLLSISSERGFSYRDTIMLSHLSEKYRFMVPREDLLISCFSPSKAVSYVPSDGAGFAANLVSIKPGEDCPAIRMSSGLVNSVADTAFLKIRLRKNYCRLRLRLKRTGTEGASLSFKVDGKIAGYGLMGEPVPGPFYARMSAEENEAFIVNLPRQKDNSLILNIMDGLEVVRGLSLGVYIEASGYDWDAPDLEDIDMELDFDRSVLTLTINKWTEEIPFEILI